MSACTPGRPGARPREGPLPGNQLAVPPQDRVRRHDRHDVREDPPAETLTDHGEPATFVVAQPHAPAVQLRLEHAVLFRRNSTRSRCSRSIQPTNAAMIKGSGSTHGVYAKAVWMELSDITRTRVAESRVEPTLPAAAADEVEKADAVRQAERG